MSTVILSLHEWSFKVYISMRHWPWNRKFPPFLLPPFFSVIWEMFTLGWKKWKMCWVSRIGLRNWFCNMKRSKKERWIAFTGQARLLYAPHFALFNAQQAYIRPSGIFIRKTGNVEDNFLSVCMRLSVACDSKMLDTSFQRLHGDNKLSPTK